MNNDYSSKDFTSVYEDLLAIVEASTTLWNPRYSTEADPGVVILKAMALLEDKSNYRFDMSRAQAYLDTVSDRTSAYDLLAMLGYVMQGRRAAEGFITVKNTSLQACSIPQFSVVTNPTKEVLFFTKESVSVPGSSSLSVPVQAGTIFQIVKQGISEFTLKDIDEKGRLFLGKTGLAQNGIYLKSSTASTKWIYLDYVLLRETDTYYTVGTSETGEMYIQFPDDFASLVGNDKLTVYATYTSGANSNIAKNVLTTFSDKQKDASEQTELSAILTVSQTEDIYSGQDEETIDHAIQTYYETKDVCSTLVTAQDFTTALRYLLISNVRAFSNVILETPQTQTRRMMTVQQGVSYVQLLRPANLNYNEIKVMPTRYSSDYYQSFKPYLSYSENYDLAKSKLETQIDEKLLNQKALPVDIRIAGYDTNSGQVDSSLQPILAVFTPTIYVYLRDSSLSQQLIAREAIKRYFHTTYNMKNLAPGKLLSESRIAEDIKSLSTNILAVTVIPFEYKISQFSKSYLSSDSAQFDPDTSLVRLQDDTEYSKNWRLSILEDAILAGDVPFFKFRNRQNSYSKTNSLYAALPDAEQVLPIPWGATKYSDEIYFPKGCELRATAILGSDYENKTHTLTADEMVQLRRPVFIQSPGHGWSQGMKWTYTLIGYSSADYLSNHQGRTIYLDLQGDTGITLPVGSKFTPAADFYFEGDLTPYFEEGAVSCDNGKTAFSEGSEYAVQSQLVLKGGHLPLSSFTWEGPTPETSPTYYLLRPDTELPSGSTYVLQEGESLTIRKASSSEEVARYKAGDPILLENVTITRAPSVSAILESALNTISRMEPKTSTISSEYVYFLCLNTTKSTKTLINGEKYTLEEGEFLIYADAGITEYVTLGPGTEIFLSTAKSVSLLSHNNYDISSVLPSDFEPLPTDLGVNFYEITSYVQGDEIKSDKAFSLLFTKTGGVFLPEWGTPNGGARVTAITSEGQKTEYNISANDYSIRHLAILKTTELGYAIHHSTSFQLSGSSLDEKVRLDLSFPDDLSSESSEKRLYSSTAVSGFAGSVLTLNPIKFVAATIPLEEITESPGGSSYYIENLSTVTNSLVTGVRKSVDTEVPSPYDLLISYSGGLVKDVPNVIATFSIPKIDSIALFRLRTLSQSVDSDISFKIFSVSSSKDEKKELVPLYFPERGSANLSYADLVFILPSSSSEGSISIELYTSTSLASFEVVMAIEDISILDASQPFDPQSGVQYNESTLPKQLGGEDEDSEAYAVINRLITISQEAETAGRTPFNWLYYSLDRVSSPLDPISFFISTHPRSDKVFPLYIEDVTKVKFPQRG